ncbi:MAG: phenylacetate-CoA oxygenase subunit PaaC [Bdellovibrionales bacterium]|nr:phenylacetate-CoA oxygenase subunit PaaC [Bdellovibrionales bacterium]
MSAEFDFSSLDESDRSDVFEYALRLGDDHLVLGHRISEWCGHGPILEEDIALANIALDLIGAGTNFLRLAAQAENAGRDEDRLAYFRNEYEFKNLMLVEQPNGDFGKTMARQFLFDAHIVPLLDRLGKSACKPLADVSMKTLKEAKYHLRHSSEWVIRLGDGTAESKERVQRAVDELWTFTGELFVMDELETRLAAKGIVPSRSEIQPIWQQTVSSVFSRATLEVPTDEQYMHSGSRSGRHSEHLGPMLAEMQIVARSYPDARW